MRLKIAKAVDGCLYNFLNVVPGSLSRYSKDARDETDILAMSWSPGSRSYRFIIVMFEVTPFESQVRMTEW